MFFDTRCDRFVHPMHQRAFSNAAKAFDCHILVRETGSYAIQWIGREGYTGKRADLKAKSARKGVADYEVTGLVCSPYIHPGAPGNLKEAREFWDNSLPLITIPKGDTGFDDRSGVDVPTPYILQNNPRHRHYGCVAWVEMGLVMPRYVHGDYDLYALVPAGRPFDPHAAAAHAQERRMTPMTRPGSGLAERVNAGSVDRAGPLSFRVATYINNQVAEGCRSYADALMVNHSENINRPEKGITHETVLAFMAQPKAGALTRILNGKQEHMDFFRHA